jgi:hypothetical protein
MKLRTMLLPGFSLLAFGLANAVQPTLSIPVVNHPCQDGPQLVGGKPVVAETVVDKDGFTSLFNGKDLTGWWENCAPHTSDKVLGGVWMVDPSQQTIYSREEGPNGDILVTNQNFDNYELIFDLWPTYGNDGGIFNRVTASGKNWQTTIDYIQGSGVGGSFNEGGWTAGNLNDDPFRFGTGGATLPDITTWTTFTKDLVPGPTTFGCSAGGCLATDFVKVWNIDGWNQMRVKFYDGLVVGKSVTMESFIRKAQTPEVPWVPVYKNTKAQVTPAGPVAFQIHGGGRWKAGSYNLYRNIKIRPLKDNGEPLTVNVSTNEKTKMGTGNFSAPQLKIVEGFLVGELDTQYEVTLKNIRGQVLEKFQNNPGVLHHAIANNLHGVLVAELKNNRGIAHIRLSHI